MSDICKALGLTQPSKVKERLKSKGVNTIPTLTKGGTQLLLYINESNLYKTIFQSRKESAERFTDWVTEDVIPTIRETGVYLTEELKQYIEQTIPALINRVRELEQRLDVIGAFDNEWMLKKIQDATKSKVMKMTENPIHKTLWSRFFFAGIYKELKDTFHVSTLKSIPSANLDDALSIIHYWCPTDSFLKTRLIRLKADQELNLLHDKKIIALLQYLKETKDGAINPFAMQTEE